MRCPGLDASHGPAGYLPTQVSGMTACLARFLLLPLAGEGTVTV
jgi:hypothetical protein